MQKREKAMVKISITASHDGGNIEVISIGETVISGRTAKVTVTLHIKPGEFFRVPGTTGTRSLERVARDGGGMRLSSRVRGGSRRWCVPCYQI